MKRIQFFFNFISVFAYNSDGEEIELWTVTVAFLYKKATFFPIEFIQILTDILSKSEFLFIDWLIKPAPPSWKVIAILRNWTELKPRINVVVIC